MDIPFTKAVSYKGKLIYINQRRLFWLLTHAHREQSNC